VTGYLRSHAVYPAPGDDAYRLVRNYRLGYVGRPLQGDEAYTGALAIPYLTPTGVASIKFRMLGNGDGAKCLHHTGQKPRLYNTLAYFAADDVIGITEGEIDALIATELLGLPSVGIPGAEMWKGENADMWGPVFRDFQRVIVLADGDAINPATGLRPGRELAKRIVETLGWRVTVVECPEGEDVSSMAAVGRLEELRQRCWPIGEDDAAI
jgi:hypothetical protein